MKKFMVAALAALVAAAAPVANARDAARRNEQFNNVIGAAKGAWCESVKAFGIKTFGWGPLFEAD